VRIARTGSHTPDSGTQLQLVGSPRALKAGAPAFPLPTLNSLLPAPAVFNSPRDILVRLYRRICVLQARGEIAEAARLAIGELPAAVQTLRTAESVDDRELQRIFETEEERVASASVLAELILPSLADRLGGAAPLSASTSRSVHRASETPRPGSTAEIGALPVRPAVIPGIADFIDEMISQERPSPRVHQTSHA
jgi:hypothetical protein